MTDETEVRTFEIDGEEREFVSPGMDEITESVTVGEMESIVEDTESVEFLEDLRDAEQDGKDRVTAIEAIDDRLADLDESDEDDAGGDADEDEGDDTPTPRVGRAAADAAYDVAGNVKVREPSGGRTRILPCTPRVKRQIEIGELEYLGPA